MIKITFVLGFILAVQWTSPQAAFKHATDMNNERSSSQPFESRTEGLTPQEDESGLAKYPDKPLASIPQQAVSMRYIVEHRSALNGKTITVRGIVARTLWPDANAPPGQQSMAYPQPRIFLADNLRKGRDKNYDVAVLLPEGERGYVVGQRLKLRVTVDASKVAVVMRKSS